MHVCRLSSAVLGVLVGYAIRDASVCPSGYAAVHVILWWLRACVPRVLAYLISVDTGAYRDRNRAFVDLNYISSAPRLAQTVRPRLVHCAILSVLCGACDALSLTMRPSIGDIHVLALGAVAVSSGRSRLLAVSLGAYVFCTRPLPAIHGIVRGVATMVSVLASMAILPPAWSIIRVVVAVLVAVFSATASCSSKLGALSPALLVSVALFDLRLNPMIVFAFAALIVL